MVRIAAGALVLLASSLGSSLASPSKGLPVSKFPDRGDRDLYCPEAPEPSPLVVLAPELGRVRGQLAHTAERLAAAGFVVAVVDPDVDRAAYARRVADAIDVLVAPKASPTPSEQLCQPGRGVAVWGIGRGAIAALDVAAAREAGRPLSAVVAAFAAENELELALPSAPPVLVVEGDRVPARSRWQLSVTAAHSCDLGGTCTRSITERRGDDGWLISRDRGDAVLRATAAWLRAHAAADPAAQEQLAAWRSRISFDDEQLYRPSESYERWTLFSAPLVLGATSQGDNGFVWGVRPELVRAWTTERGPINDSRETGNGLGSYLELLRANGSTIAGGGLTYLRYKEPLAIAPSIGLYHRWTEPANQVGVTASVYLGLRVFAEYFDVPFGIRGEVRYGLGDSTDRAVLVSVDLDVLTVLAMIGVSVAAVASHD